MRLNKNLTDEKEDFNRRQLKLNKFFCNKIKNS